MSSLKDLKSAENLEDVANVLGYKPKGLSYLLYHLSPSEKYTEFKIAKKGGGTRTIRAPTPKLKVLQQHLNNLLTSCREEIEKQNNRRPLSHGFRRKYSIITNAALHKNRRYVLNLDLQDFFPSFNFGRVRGFFIRNADFQLNEKAATIIAQIACFDNQLPQGSPCSPIISDLIAHVLDVRLAQLARATKCTYSRYADDLTFSTNLKKFPAALASNDQSDTFNWSLSASLTEEIQRAGFAINLKKVRMQCRGSRQVVTGLTVNSKVNVRSEMNDLTRVMCRTLFYKGYYHRAFQTFTKTNVVEGMLNHVHLVKDKADLRTSAEKKRTPIAIRSLYRDFLFFKTFVNLQKPIILCEGKTDSIYLQYAMQALPAFQPLLVEKKANRYESKVSFFRYGGMASEILQLHGGSGDLKFFLLNYPSLLKKFKYAPMKHAAVVLIDNDDGAKDLFPVIKNTYGKAVAWDSTEPFFALADNLYLVKTPSLNQEVKSYIEQFFEKSVLETKLDGKSFNPNKEHEADGEYGKSIFADRVIRANAKSIDFSGFAKILQRLVAVISDYQPKLPM